ncbi:hypothetical protein BB561_006930 [Smittium simulii]|uniref:[histone H3]-lysine(4) N-trimethyltransferase n=1 Tax=Smittium simulii TaxID=133385 RepID=A0A2T9XZW5_9FUNG|nr:hypothetical protein BB561_006930 [Smittium simulii]
MVTTSEYDSESNFSDNHSLKNVFNKTSEYTSNSNKSKIIFDSSDLKKSKTLPISFADRKVVKYNTESSTDENMDINNEIDSKESSSLLESRKFKLENSDAASVKKVKSLVLKDKDSSISTTHSEISHDTESDYTSESDYIPHLSRKGNIKLESKSTVKRKDFSSHTSNLKSVGKNKLFNTDQKHQLDKLNINIKRIKLKSDFQVSKKSKTARSGALNASQSTSSTESSEIVDISSELKPSHSTGSARTQGYYKIENKDKINYLLPLLPYLHWSNNFYYLLKPSSTFINNPNSTGSNNNFNSLANDSCYSFIHTMVNIHDSNYYFYNPVIKKSSNKDSKGGASHSVATSSSNSRTVRAANRKLRAQLNQYKTSIETELDNNKTCSKQNNDSLINVNNNSLLQILDLNSLESRTKSLFFAKSGIHNFGLFSRETIYAGEFVIEYIGERIRSSLADHREKIYTKLGLDQDCCYLFRVDDETVIDATVMGNIARFVNHSCNPNCIAKIIVVDGSKRIGIYARSDISIGDEITYDYKFTIEDTDKKIPCLCGSVNCRGYLN